MDEAAPPLIVLYSFALAAALAVSFPWWLWKMATTHKYREGLAERLGRVPAHLRGGSRPTIWIHAVSVGEVIAISGLVGELRSRVPGHRVVVSTTTLTGQRIARERFGVESVFYYPLDFAFAVRRYLRALRPEVFVLAETEFWPRMLWECRRNRIPVAVVNARISDRSFPRYLRLHFLWSRILSAVTVALAQTGEDASRLRAIGVPQQSVQVGGNLKFDVRVPARSGLVEELLRALPADAKVIVCGSTLEGEERFLVEAWPALTSAEPRLRMVLAPRHPERFEDVATLLQRSGVPWIRRSAWKAAPFEAASILLLDSIGELASVYSLAAVAFVGGSLVAAGGHNPLEAAQFGVPILMGPHYENFREIVARLKERRAIRIVDSAGLREALLDALRDGAASRAMGDRAREIFDAEAGATAKTLDAILALLPEKSA